MMAHQRAVVGVRGRRAIAAARMAVRLLARRGTAGLLAGWLALRKRPWSGVALQAAGIWLATRAVFVLITYFAVTFASTNHNGSLHLLALAHDAWKQNDAVWYLNIARYGYWRPTPATLARDHGQSPTAFFPLYPLLIAVFTFVLGGAHRLLAGMLVSNLGVLAAFVGLGLLAAHETGRHTAARTVLIAAAAPLAFFLTAAYSDGLFFALAAFALLAARRGAWRWAIACGVLAGLTRFTAIVLVLPLAWEYARQHAWLPHPRLHLPRWRTSSPTPPLIEEGSLAPPPHAEEGSLAPPPHAEEGSLAPPLHAEEGSLAPPLPAGEGGGGWGHLARLAHGAWRAAARDRQSGWPGARSVALGIAVAGGAPLGISLYAAYLGLRFGDPLSFLHAEQQGWLHVATPPWLSVPHAIAVYFALAPWSYDQARALVDYGVILFCVAITLLAARRMPASFLLYMLSLLYLSIAAPVPWSYDIYISSGRYLLPAIPVYLVLGRWAGRSSTLDAALIGAGFALQGLFTGLWLATGINFF